MIELLFKINIGLAVIALAYEFGISKTSNHKLARFYLLFGSLLTIIAPWILQTQGFQPLVTTSITLPSFAVQSDVVNAQEAGSTITGLNLVYTIGFLLLLIQTITGIIKVIRIRRNGSNKEFNGISYTEIPSKYSFSFLNQIYISNKVSSTDLSFILNHELVHVNQLHYVDLFFGQLLKIIFWFNPFAHLLSKQIEQNHEFLADEWANEEQKSIYSTLILNEARRNLGIPVHSFSHRKLTKSRIQKLYINSNKSSIMKNLAIIISSALLVFTISCTGQQTMPDDEELNNVKKAEELDQQPEYPGGMDAMIAFLQENIKYPTQAKNDSAEGTVFVKFIVSETGDLTNLSVVKSVNEHLDASALNTISSMPKWNPGKIGEEAVSVEMVLPIKYVLQ